MKKIKGKNEIEFNGGRREVGCQSFALGRQGRSISFNNIVLFFSPFTIPSFGDIVINKADKR